jgi:hypothetical protein
VGRFNFWKLIDVTDRIDGFVPTATLIGLYVGWREGHIGARARPATQLATSPKQSIERP